MYVIVRHDSMKGNRKRTKGTSIHARFEAVKCKQLASHHELDCPCYVSQ
jgi:hypothetical protein